MSDNLQKTFLQETTFTINKDEILETAESLGYASLTDEMVESILDFISNDEELWKHIEDSKKFAVREIARAK